MTEWEPGSRREAGSGSDRMNWKRVPPESGAVVMSIGVVSVASGLAGFPVLSLVFLVVAAALWGVLAVVFLARISFDTKRWLWEAGSPSALTCVAATGVLGLGLHFWAAAWVFLAAATLLWLGLMPLVLRGWRTPTVGVNFLVSVATQSLAVLAGQLAIDMRSPLLLWVCAGATALGLVLYAAVLVRFDFRQLSRSAGDHWIAGGALAISTVATGKLHSGLQALEMPTAAAAVRTIDLVLWAITVGWYLVLVVFELLAPRLRYNFRRWATVFPLGMTCTACFSTAAASGIAWMADAAWILLWPALVVLCLTAWGTVRSFLREPRFRR
ncbi:tellurite resistance/C4-dicarboxylate transporter family protein [Saccharopolyspora sp. NPDC000995]